MILGNLPVRAKLSLIIVMLMASTLPVIGYLALDRDKATTKLAEQELAGALYLEPVHRLMWLSFEFRDAVARAEAGAPGAEETVFELAKQIESQLPKVEAADSLHASDVPMGELPKELRAAWGKARTAPKSDRRMRAEEFAAASREFVSVVGEKSQLILDPAIDTLYLALSVTQGLPDIMDDTGLLRVAASLAADGVTSGPEAGAAVAELAGRVRVNRERTERSLKVAIVTNSALATRVGILHGALDSRLSAYEKRMLDLAAAVASGQDPGFPGKEVAQEGTALTEQISRLYAACRLAVAELLEIRVRDLKSDRVYVYGFTLLGMLVAALFALTIARAISAQTEAVLGTLRSAEAGDLDARSAVMGRDELGHIAESVNATVAKLADLVRGQEHENRATQSGLREFREVLARASKGDFSARAPEAEGVMGALADSLNGMIVELSRLVSGVRSAATTVATSTQQILVSSSQMAKGAEDQALQIANTSSAVDEMAVSVRRVSENADSAAGASQQASSAASEGGQSVRTVVAHMTTIRDTVQETAQKIKALGESSLEIGEIVKVITNIAGRTNLLALNATIEAARAGEAGRGFAVVADEVRRLADQSGKASNDIAILIQAIQGDTGEAVRSMERATREVNDGVRVVGTAGQTLDRIVHVVGESAGLSSEISMAAKQQSQASDAIAESMAQISRISKETASGAGQARIASNDLMRMSEELRQSVMAFRLASAAEGRGDAGDARNG